MRKSWGKRRRIQKRGYWKENKQGAGPLPEMGCNEKDTAWGCISLGIWRRERVGGWGWGFGLSWSWTWLLDHTQYNGSLEQTGQGRDAFSPSLLLFWPQGSLRGRSGWTGAHWGWTSGARGPEVATRGHRGAPRRTERKIERVDVGQQASWT